MGGWGALSQYDSVLKKGGNLDTETDTHTGSTPDEREGGDQGGNSIGQGRTKTASKPPEARREAGSRGPPHHRGCTSPPTTPGHRGPGSCPPELRQQISVV